LVVKREKSKTHEAQTTRVLEIQQRKRAGRCCCARPRMMTKTFMGVTVESRQRQRSPTARLGRGSGSRRRAYCQCYIQASPCDNSSPGKKALGNVRYVTAQALAHRPSVSFLFILSGASMFESNLACQILPPRGPARATSDDTAGIALYRSESRRRWILDIRLGQAAVDHSASNNDLSPDSSGITGEILKYAPDDQSCTR
jgi:hypothetical protein